MRASEPAGSVLPFAVAACIAGTVAFAIYTRTLLPGVDLGDTGGFQAAVLWPETSARAAYPLYYALARPFVGLLTPDMPARGLNLFSALTAGLAVGLLSFVAAAVTRSVLAGVAAGVALAFSYTFWTQAVIAEVYSLHLLLIGASMAALVAWSRQPTLSRLAVFFAVYALSFGNHLGSILFLVPFGAFLFAAHPRPLELIRPRVIALAMGIAAAGALQYAPNLVWTWTTLDAPHAWSGRLAMFWIDTTKADWRETMVLGVSVDQAWTRLVMAWWDVNQQFGLVGVAVAAIGAVRLWGLSRPWALFAFLAYTISFAFALTYNVGDTHVFLLPAHFIAAFVMAAAVATGPRREWAAIVLLLYGGWRAWDTYPAADRHRDRRADALVSRAAAGVTARSAVLLSRMPWESENALLYAARYERPDLAWSRLPPILPRLPVFVRDNHAIARDVVLTADAAADVVMTYGTAFPIVRDELPAATPMMDVIRALPRGTPYVLTLLEPLSAFNMSDEELSGILEALAGRKAPPYAERQAPPYAGGESPPNGDRGAPLYGAPKYQVWAGLTGDAPSLHQGADRPFVTTFTILGDPFLVRMDAWLPHDTFRRGGFGHVIRGRQRMLYVERGASLLWFRPDGSPVTTYAAGLYAPQPRFRIPALPAPQLATR